MSGERGKLFILSGPSGAGKSTVMGRILQEMDNVYFSVSATTRAPRPGEADGVNYHFITGEEFARLIEEGGFLEFAQYVGNYYGTPAAPIRKKLAAGVNVFLDIEVQGARQVKEKMPEAVAIFLLPPTPEDLERRLRRRGTDSDERIARRIEAARAECAQVDLYDYIVINDDIDRSVEEVRAIVTAERCKRECRDHLIW